MDVEEPGQDQEVGIREAVVVAARNQEAVAGQSQNHALVPSPRLATKCFVL